MKLTLYEYAVWGLILWFPNEWLSRIGGYAGQKPPINPFKRL